MAFERSNLELGRGLLSWGGGATLREKDLQKNTDRKSAEACFFDSLNEGSYLSWRQVFCTHAYSTKLRVSEEISYSIYCNYNIHAFHHATTRDEIVGGDSCGIA